MTADVLAALEAATEGSRELDWRIAEALGEVPKHSIRSVGFDYDWYRKEGEWALWRARDSEGRSVDLWQPMQRSTSLDAALTLLQSSDDLHLEFGHEDAPDYALQGCVDASASTMPLAVCALALRSQAGRDE